MLTYTQGVCGIQTVSAMSTMFEFIESLCYISFMAVNVAKSSLISMVRWIVKHLFHFPRIVCTTGTYYGQEEQKSGQVMVTVALTLSAKSEEKFTYVVRIVDTEFKSLV